MHTQSNIRHGRRDLPTWRDRILAAFAIVCLAVPLGIAAAGNLAGIH